MCLIGITVSGELLLTKGGERSDSISQEGCGVNVQSMLHQLRVS